MTVAKKRKKTRAAKTVKVRGFTRGPCKVHSHPSRDPSEQSIADVSLSYLSKILSKATRKGR